MSKRGPLTSSSAFWCAPGCNLRQENDGGQSPGHFVTHLQRHCRMGKSPKPLFGERPDDIILSPRFRMPPMLHSSCSHRPRRCYCRAGGSSHRRHFSTRSDPGDSEGPVRGSSKCGPSPCNFATRQALIPSAGYVRTRSIGRCDGSAGASHRS